MKKIHILLFPALLLGLPLVASADSWNNHHGYGKGHRYHSYKEEYWEGNCKVKRKMKKNGEYKEERKCKGPQAYYAPAPVYLPAPAPVVIEPGIAVHGTIRIAH